MAKPRDLAIEEHEALQEVLRKWFADGQDWRAIGVALGYPAVSASQTMSNVARETAKGRVGADMAARIYKRLGVTREAFLRSRALGHLLDRHQDIEPLPSVTSSEVTPADSERVYFIAGQIGLTREDARRLLKEAAFTGEITDEEIATRLRALAKPAKPSKTIETFISNDDDFGGGASTLKSGVSPKARRR